MIRRIFTPRCDSVPTLLVQASRMEDADILELARKLDRTHGSPKVGDRLRTYVSARKRHFSPASW